MNAEHRRKPSEQFLILGMHPKVLLSTGVAALGSLTVAASLIIAAVHNATQQVRVIRDELIQRPPANADDLDRVQRQINDTTKNLRRDVKASIDQIDTTPRSPSIRPQKRHNGPHSPRTAPAATPKPTPSPAPTPRLLPPLPPLIP